jgi:hypothetical protein
MASGPKHQNNLLKRSSRSLNSTVNCYGPDYAALTIHSTGQTVTHCGES